MAYKQKLTKNKEKVKEHKKKEFPIYALEDPESFGMTEKQVIDLWQQCVDTGIVWNLQGWYGRNAQALLDAGIIKYPRKHTAQSKTDYYGNPIPSHEEAKKRGLYKKE
jgi:hypothetical protein